MQGVARVGVIAGLRLEIAGFGDPATSGILTFASGGSASAARAQIAKWIAQRAVTHLLSFGLAGGLAPAAAPGMLVIGRRVFDRDSEFDTDPGWSAALRLLLPDARSGDLEGVDLAVTSPQSKRALHQRRFALCCDMESHAVAAAATRAGIPFAAVRAIADPADRVVPYAALAGLGPDGGTKPMAVVRSLLSQPNELPALVRVARDSRRGLETLNKVAPKIAAALIRPAAEPVADVAALAINEADGEPSAGAAADAPHDNDASLART